MDLGIEPFALESERDPENQKALFPEYRTLDPSGLSKKEISELRDTDASLEKHALNGSWLAQEIQAARARLSKKKVFNPTGGETIFIGIQSLELPKEKKSELVKERIIDTAKTAKFFTKVSLGKKNGIQVVSATQDEEKEIINSNIPAIQRFLEEKRKKPAIFAEPIPSSETSNVLPYFLIIPKPAQPSTIP